MSKDELDEANESGDQKNKKIIRGIIDPTPGFFVDDRLNPNEQNLQNTTDKVVPKTEDFFMADDEFDSFKKPGPTTINIDQQKDENYDDLVMISDDDEVKISCH